ncbi:MAG: DUF3127 domain-containing protein [Bacteroidales bacterium]|nr:DUF3127 domain-containing protein [Bacteroidales bacterium]
MEIKGKIVQVLEEKSGTSAKGGWRKQEYVLETQDQYPKKICFMAWGDKIDDFAIKENQELEVSIDIESREFNDRWYTDVKAWKVASIGGAKETSQSAATPQNSAPMPDEEPGGLDLSDDNDDLPF